MDFISESTPKANKEHTCMWCEGVIKKGEIYKKQVLKTDYIYTWKNHIKCSRLFNELSIGDNDCGEGVGSETFMQYVYDFIYSKLDEEKHKGWFGEAAVDKAIELLDIHT